MRLSVLFILTFLSKTLCFSIFDLTQPKNSSNLSSSYLPAAIQINVHLLQQIDYMNSRKHRVVFIEHNPASNIVLLEYADVEIDLEEKKLKNSTDTLRNLLLSLHKEAKRSHMDNFLGFNDEILNQLVASSALNAADQFQQVLSAVNTSSFKEVNRNYVSKVLTDLKDKNSPIYKDLSQFLALKYTP